MISASTRRSSWQALGVLLSLILIVFFLGACSGNNSAPANIVGYNHTDRHIARYSVNGYGSKSIGAHEGGGSFTCCIGVPIKWQPDMTVTVTWQWHESEEIHSAEIPVPPYEKFSRLAVHFLRTGEVKAFATMYGLPHPDYPLQGEEATMKPGVPLRPHLGPRKD